MLAKAVSIITAAGPHPRGHSPLGCASRLLSGDSRFQNRTILPLNKLSRAPEPPSAERRLLPSLDAVPWHRLRPAAHRVGDLRRDGPAGPALEDAGSSGQSFAGRRGLASEIAGLNRADGLEAVVLGFPRRLNGEEHDQSRAVRTMADQLRRVVTVPLHLQDERLSSREAEALLSRTEKDWRKRKLQLDAVAAAVILQDYLDSLAPARGAGDETDSEELA